MREIRDEHVFNVAEERGLDPTWPTLPHAVYLSEESQLGICPSVWSKGLIGLKRLEGALKRS